MKSVRSIVLQNLYEYKIDNRSIIEAVYEKENTENLEQCLSFYISDGKKTKPLTFPFEVAYIKINKNNGSMPVLLNVGQTCYGSGSVNYLYKLNPDSSLTKITQFYWWQDTSLDITVTAKSKATSAIVGKKLFNLTVTNTPPVIAQAGAQVGTVNQGASTITLKIAGTESAPLTYEIVGNGYKVTYKGTVYIVTQNGTQGFSVGALTGRRDNETRDSSSMLIVGFDKPVLSVSASASDNGGGSTFSAYDADNNLLKTVAVTGSTLATYTISGVGEISKVIFASTGGWIGNLAYSVNVIPGDINFDRSSDLADAILMLQVLSEILMPADMIYPQLSISGTRVGIEDVIVNLQQFAGLR